MVRKKRAARYKEEKEVRAGRRGVQGFFVALLHLISQKMFIALQ